MPEVNVTVNGRVFRVTCDAGQEGRLQQLAGYFDRHVTQMSRELGQIGDGRLMLLSALTVCDELFEARRRIADFERAGEKLPAETAGGASRLIEEAAQRIEALAARASRA
ncbi:MAG: cell division protein ZapA [Amphiplicatus sp.]